MTYYEEIKKHYVEEGMTDTEIAEIYGFTRTWTTHLRKDYGIKTRKTTGVLGEELAIKKLKELFYDVVDMNDVTKTSPFDILINGVVKIEVKSSKEHNDGFYHFIFTEQETNNNIVSDNRLRLKNGRTKKIFSKTCDFIVLVGIGEDDNDYWVVPSDEISDYQQGRSLKPFKKQLRKSEYNKYYKAFECIK